MRSLLARFSEPSSWGPVAGFLAAVGINTEGWWQSAMFALSGIAGLVMFFLPEKGSKDK